MTPTLREDASDYIAGKFLAVGGDDLVSVNPAAPDSIIWSGSPCATHVDDAVRAARGAGPAWGGTPLSERIELLRRWQSVLVKHTEKLAGLITDEMGKTLAEARFEAGALSAKVDTTLGEHSLARIREYEVAVNETRTGRCRYKAHGVMAVIGPFNFPAHLPNGHFVPALLAGNTIMLKPSDKAPAVGQMLAEFMDEAGAPPGVFNVVQGGAEIASALVSHGGIDGVLFTGSWSVGRRILEANLDQPGRLIALEMGGNNPAVVMPSASISQAVIECVRAAFATTGQRCTCTRRIILHRDVADRFIPAFCKAASLLVVGPGRSDEPVFMGPLISETAVESVVAFQSELVQRGGRILVESTAIDRPGYFITPGVIEVESFTLEHDCEVFGPLVQIALADDLEHAIEQANATQYGLAASIFTNDDDEYEAFFHRCRAGCINRNTGTAGASSQLPFGGVGRSGNHRPAGAFSIEYCAYPVANMVETGADAAIPAGMKWEDAWLESS